MTALQQFRLLWRHSLFRRLLAVRVTTQAADGVLQVAMAGYVVFSPQQQPDAASITLVLAVTLLPYSVVGPFVGGLLDRWNRRQVIIATDLLRVGIALALAALIVGGTRTPGTMTVFAGLVLVAMSLNRFLMAGLSAAIPHAVDEDELLAASSVMPIVGPLGAAIGAAIVVALRLGTGGVLETYQSDALAFALAAVGFGVSVALGLRIGRTELGPDADERAHAADDRPSHVIAGLLAALRHLRERRPAALGLGLIGLQRLTFGVLTVAVMLVYRNAFHAVTDVQAALADFAIWGAALAVGFLSAAVVTPWMTARLGLRRWTILLLALNGAVVIVPGSIFTRPTLVVAAYVIGLTAQSLKMCVDTLVQAHVDDRFKGRVFTLYDMLFNATQVAGAALCWWLLPVDGRSVGGFVLIGLVLLALAWGFARASARLGAERFEKGTRERTPVAAAG